MFPSLPAYLVVAGLGLRLGAAGCGLANWCGCGVFCFNGGMSGDYRGDDSDHSRAIPLV